MLTITINNLIVIYFSDLLSPRKSADGGGLINSDNQTQPTIHEHKHRMTNMKQVSGESNHTMATGFGV